MKQPISSFVRTQSNEFLKTVSEGEKVMGESAEDVKREEEIVKVSKILTDLRNLKRNRKDFLFDYCTGFVTLPVQAC